MKGFYLLFLLISLISFLEIAETKKVGGGIKVKKPKLKKPKPIKIKETKPIKMKKSKPIKIHSHVHHKGIHHKKSNHKKHAHKVIQPTEPVPLYSPPFTGIDNGQIPIDSQVALIVDWLSKVGATIDVFLRMQDTYPEESTEQRQLIKNVYPPLRILLEAHHAHESV